MFKKGDDIIFSDRVRAKHQVESQGVVMGVVQRDGRVLYMCRGYEVAPPYFEVGPLYIEAEDVTKNHFVSPKLPPTAQAVVERGAVALKQDRHPSSQKFHDICNDMKQLHDRKQADYGRSTDPFANVRASADFGIPGWVGCMVRANDKMRRIQAAAQGSELQNEGVVDSLMDLAVYAIIGLVLYQEEHQS